MNFSPSTVEFKKKKKQWCYCRKVKEHGKKKSISACHVTLTWTLCMLPGGPKLKEDRSGSNCSTSMCPSALRLWWEVAQWRTSSSTLSSDASLWCLPEPSHTCMWIQGVWRCMPRVLKQFCRSTRDSSGWDPARHLRQQNTIQEVLEMGVQGSGGGHWALSAVQSSLPSELSEDALGEPEAFGPPVSHLSLLLMLNFQFSSFFFFWSQEYLTSPPLISA